MSRACVSQDAVSVPELRSLFLASIRRLKECTDVADVEIVRVDDIGYGNWSFGEIKYGSAFPSSVNRAAIYVQAQLRRRYHLLTD